MEKNYAHHVIRLRKGKPNKSKVYWLVVILNTKKASSHGMLERLGFFRYGPNSVFSINYQRLSFYLNKGVELKKSVKRFIHWYALLNKYYIENSRIKNHIIFLNRYKKLYNKMGKLKLRITRKKKINKKELAVLKEFLLLYNKYKKKS